jgi:hypothetical protein
MFNKTSSPDYYWDGVPDEIMDGIMQEDKWVRVKVWHCEIEGHVMVCEDTPLCVYCDNIMIEIGWMEESNGN